MKKIYLLISIVFFISFSFAEEAIYTSETESNIYYFSKTKNRQVQLTEKGIDREPVLSPNGKIIVFVRKSHHVIPEPCTDFSNTDSEDGNEIWMADLDQGKSNRLVKNNFNCNEPSEKIVDPFNLQFSPDGKTLYFQTSAWATSGAIHAVEIDGKNLRFVTDGNEYHVVQQGIYKGDLIVNQHRYRFKGDTPLGSYDWDWLFSPQGKQIKLYRKE